MLYLRGRPLLQGGEKPAMGVFCFLLKARKNFGINKTETEFKCYKNNQQVSYIHKMNRKGDQRHGKIKAGGGK